MEANSICIEQRTPSGGENHRPAFVYGTLMKGQRAEHLLADATYVGRCQLHDFAMYNLGRYPGIQPCAGEVVYGELYLIQDQMVKMLDEYEEEPSMTEKW